MSARRSDSEMNGKGLRPLARLCRGAMETGRFLPLALKIAEALEALHKQGEIHGNLNPRCILVDEGTGALRISRFSGKNGFPGDYPPPGTLPESGPSPPYMSPEQTGRMNRPLDQRSDLYSLGVVFYQMLTGSLPFQAQDLMEWVHCHIAHPVRPPREVAAQVPAPLSDLVLKLLAKDAEDRYQSAAGLAADLRISLASWLERGEIAPFPLGEEDVSERLLVPQRLYGREKERGVLVGVFQRVLREGSAEVVMVSGYPGIGKSSLVRELYQPVLRETGQFLSGKFDQLRQQVPYATVADAFRAEIRQILAQGEERIAQWRGELLEALGTDAALLVEIIPQLELILGPQPAVAQLPPSEAQNRFHVVFRQLLALFARPEHPLVLFLDDLQWVDPATLKLIEHILTHPGTGHLLLIGAYRDNEVGPDHPLFATLHELREHGVPLTSLTLAPLRLEEVAEFVADTVCAERGARCRPLTRLIFEKTGGNPFFVTHFLGALYQEGLLAFDGRHRRWSWDLAGIRAQGYTDNVVDLMVAKLKKLSGTTLEGMKLASCLGNRVELQNFSMISGLAPEQARSALSEAVQEGLLLRLDGEYAFLHDRVLEAVYSLVPPGERAELHLKIGRLLLAQLSAQAVAERLFEVVNQLNRGAALIRDPQEKESLLRLNALAGGRAKGAVAFAAAADYLERGAALLPEDAWESRYRETFSLHLELSECLYLSGRFAEADARFSLTFDRSRSDPDRARVLRLHGRLYQSAGRFEEARKLALEALRLVGIALPDDDDALLEAFAAEREEIELLLAGRSIADLARAGQAGEPEGMIVSLLVEALGSAYATAPGYFPVLAAKAVRYSLRHGNSADSSLAYNAYAIVLIALYGEIATGCEFSELALVLAEQAGDPRKIGVVTIGHAGLVLPWRRHYSHSLPLLERSIATLLAAGDFLDLSHTLLLAAWAVVEMGESLDEVVRYARRCQSIAGEIHSDIMHQTLALPLQLAASLRGETRGEGSFDDDSFSEAECTARFEAASWHTGLAYLQVMKLICAVIYRRPEQALQAALRAEPVLRLMMAMPVSGTLCFYQALALAALYPGQPPKERQRSSRALSELLAKLEHWAQNSPENHGNRYALAAAELARIEGRELEAERLYEQAIDSARSNGFLAHQALALELAAEFHDGRGFQRFARSYLREARACYLRWGAQGKVAQLEERYPFLQRQEEGGGGGIGARIGRIDAIAVVRASQAISGEIVLERLLDILMRIALENAGAQRGSLLLARGDQLAVEIEAVLEGDQIRTVRPPRTPRSELVPESMVNYVRRTRESVILEQGGAERAEFAGDGYLLRNRPLSVLCLPIVRQADLVGLLYLENSSVRGAFSAERVQVLEVLAGQMAISLDNAQLYAGMQQENRERRRAEERVTNLLEAAPDAMVIVNQEGEISLVNSQTERVFGYRREELYGSKIEMLMPAEYRERHVGHRDGYMRDPQLRPMGSRGLELYGRHKDGHSFPVDIALSPLRTESGLLVTATVRDVSAAREAERALRDSEQRYRQLSATLEQRVKQAVEELDQKNRLLIVQSRQAIMGEMISNIAHQWRQPLNTLGLIAQELQMLQRLGKAEGGYIEASMKRTMEIIQYMSKTIDDFRFFFRPAKEKVPFRVLEVVEKTLSLLKGSFDTGGIETRIEPARDLQIYGYPNEFSQVLLNILNNAKDAFQSAGSAAPLITIGVERQDGQALLTITDNAGGIPEQILDKVFEPYFTTKGPEQGTGVGLFMCKTIVEKSMNGTLSARNVADGAQFSIRMPEWREP